MGMAKEWDLHSEGKDGECSLCEPKTCGVCEELALHTKLLPAANPLGAIEVWEHCQDCGRKEKVGMR